MDVISFQHFIELKPLAFGALVARMPHFVFFMKIYDFWGLKIHLTGLKTH